MLHRGLVQTRLWFGRRHLHHPCTFTLHVLNDRHQWSIVGLLVLPSKPTRPPFTAPGTSPTNFWFDLLHRLLNTLVHPKPAHSQAKRHVAPRAQHYITRHLCLATSIIKHISNMESIGKDLTSQLSCVSHSSQMDETKGTCQLGLSNVLTITLLVSPLPLVVSYSRGWNLFFSLIIICLMKLLFVLDRSDVLVSWGGETLVK